ncbi:MAG: AarF/ABC1/UbiB kinase family protein [Candidatus Omnitrophota bacterium]
MFLSKLKKEVHNLKRLEEIAAVFAKYGFGYIIQKFPFHPFTSKHPSEKDIFNLPLSVRLRRVLEDLGPTFVKLGQMLSMRPDIIPVEFCKEFEKLQDNVPAIEFEKIKEILEKELKKPLNQLFKHFPHNPLASASLAQVYEVHLRNKQAIVKIQKPQLREIIESDLKILEFIANFAEAHIKEVKPYNPKGLLQEFKTYILNELNFDNEVINIEVFRKNFKNDKAIYFPLVYKQFCSDKVLVIEKINGIKINDLKKIQESGLDTKQIAQAVVECVLKQIFVHGFFHGDLHSGNIFVLEDGRISFVDFGIVGRLDEDTKFKLTNIFIAAADRDTEGIIDIFRDLGALGYTDERRLKLSLERMLDKYYGIPLEEFRMNEFFKDITVLMFENKVHILPDHFLLIKSLAMLETVGKTLDPGLNLTLQIKKLADIVIKEEHSARKIARRIRKVGRDVVNLVQTFPKDIGLILNEIKKGNLKIGFEHLNLENLISMLDKLSNRLSFSLIIAALIIGSSLLMQSNTETFYGASHHLGVIGFVIAGIMGLWLLLNIIRSGKL